MENSDKFISICIKLLKLLLIAVLYVFIIMLAISMCTTGFQLYELYLLASCILVAELIYVAYKIYFISGITYGILVYILYIVGRMSCRQRRCMRRILSRYPTFGSFVIECGHRYERIRR
ncbi:MAG: hypothetical protein K2M60_01045 [Lachnospiraceae bacterium]|nr:hypothetical protein [Lachnospiraceae bacterium]